MDRFIDSLNEARDQTVARRRFNARRYITFKFVRQEPEGWPLTRPATNYEWAHVIKAMIMRRVPKTGPIHRAKLVQYVTSDLELASESEKIYVDGQFQALRQINKVLSEMCGKDKTLRTAPLMEDPEMPFSDHAIYRTEYADGWTSRIPRTIQAIVDYLPTTSVLDLMVQALFDEEEIHDPPPPPLSSP